MMNSLYTSQLEMYSFLQSLNSHVRRNDAKQYHEYLIFHFYSPELILYINLFATLLSLILQSFYELGIGCCLMMDER